MSSNPIATPLGTTLSTPSPTELQDQDPLAAEAEKASMPHSHSTQALKHIYLVVATTPCKNGRLGIGMNGKLPWPMIRADMDYFKKVTRDGSGTGTYDGSVGKVSNSVIMGRKTYESIPPRFRPLAGRNNVIVTRSKPMDVARSILDDLEKQAGDARGKRAELERKQAESPTATVTQQLKMAEAEFEVVSNDETNTVAVRSKIEGVVPGVTIGSNLRSAAEHCLSQSGEVYCIGGAEIYNAFLKDETLRPKLRILQTEIRKLKDDEEFECDTFWPEDLEDAQNGWSEVQTGQLQKWTRVEPPQGASVDWTDDEKVGVRLRVRGWEPKS
ncbi:hypothetical protein OHC33_002148 [Knufia fluminis]|uniref:Dihydrofolate reductase n=1 Tax=Knufia fluminis TaxID=191047 RepID=A0AAN8IR24_9EURO|nr:hypothetical protein OHC33_002148 [Knufia fluminis]